MLLAYGVTADVLAVAGVAAWVTVEGLFVPVAEVAGVELPPSADSVLAFAQAVQAIHAAGTVLPFRYGAAAGDASKLTELVRPRLTAFHTRLHTLAGLTEMTLRLDPEAVRPTNDIAVSRDAGGVGYLLRRKAEMAAKDAHAGGLTATVERIRDIAPFAVEVRAEAVAMPAAAVAVHALIPRAEVAVFRGLAAHPVFAPRRPVVTGPWPPYHFAAG